MSISILVAALVLGPFQAPTQPPLQTTPTSPQTAPDMQQYTDDQLGLSFTHPSSWILENGQEASPSDQGKKRKKKKPKRKETDMVEFKVPLSGAPDDADLQVMRATFSGSSDVWQTLQSTTNKNMKRTVERQWQQEILGVPMLLTRISYTDNGTPKTILTGLLYNDSAKKLLFRLTGPTSDFDKAQYEFTTSMESLRTTNNTLPKEQDPNHPSTDPKPDDKGQKHALFVPQPPAKPRLAPIAIPVVVSTKHVNLRVPKDWTATHVDGGALQLENPGLGYPLSVTVATSLDSDPPLTALTKASGASLTDFDTVVKREDTPVDTNQGGCTVTSIWRDGTNKKGRIISMEAAGVEGDFYFVITCRPVPGPSYLEQRKIIQELLRQISIEPAA